MQIMVGVLIVLSILEFASSTSVRVSGNHVTVLPGENVTLRCIANESSLSYFISNSLKWSHIPITGNITNEAILTNSFYMDEAFRSPFDDQHYSLRYEMTNSGYSFILGVSNVTYNDTGVYRCSLYNNKDVLISQSATINITVLYPVQQTKLELKNTSVTLAVSKGRSTPNTTALRLYSGNYTAICTSSGSFPAPWIKINTSSSYAEYNVTVQTLVIHEGRPQYTKNSRFELDLQSTGDYLISCESNINGNHGYPSKLASLEVSVRYYPKLNITCKDFVFRPGHRNKSIQCNVTANTNLTCHEVSWLVGNIINASVILPRGQHASGNQSHQSDRIWASCIGSHGRLKTNLTFPMLTPDHFKTAYYLRYREDEHVFTHRVHVKEGRVPPDMSTANRMFWGYDFAMRMVLLLCFLML